MGRQIINVGVVANDRSGDAIHDGLAKVNGNFAETYIFPPHVSGEWRIPQNIPNFNAGANPGANSIRMFPFFIREKLTFDALGGRVLTGASGNEQFAIYAADQSTLKPLACLASTASMSTVSAAVISATVTDTQTGPGWVWGASNCDNTGAILTAITTNHSILGSIKGSTSLSDLLGTGAGGLSGMSIAQTFGTWPDFTATPWSSFAFLTGSATVPVVCYRAKTIP